VVCDWERVHVEERSRERKKRTEIASSNQRGTRGRNVHEKGRLRACRDTVELQFFILEKEFNKKSVKGRAKARARERERKRERERESEREKKKDSGDSGRVRRGAEDRFCPCFRVHFHVCPSIRRNCDNFNPERSASPIQRRGFRRDGIERNERVTRS
jgi:hypothetical protein